MRWWWMIAAAQADLAPPAPATMACDLRRCPGQEARWLAAGEATPPDEEGWNTTCERRQGTLLCREFRSLPGLPPPEPSPEVAALLRGETRDRVRLADPSRLGDLPLPAWQPAEDRLQVAVALPPPLKGSTLLDLDPAEAVPVLSVALPLYDQPGGESIGTLRAGVAPVTLLLLSEAPSPEGWLHLRLPEGLPLQEAWTNIPPTTGRLYRLPEQEEEAAPSSTQTWLCLVEGSPLAARPGGSPLATVPAGPCQEDWRQGPKKEEDGWVQVHHAPSGLQLWTTTEGMGLSGHNLGIGGFGIGGFGIGGGGSGELPIWHLIDSPRWLYEAPGGAGGVVGLVAQGRVLVEDAQSDGWWQTSLEGPDGKRAVWIAPQASPPSTANAMAKEHEKASDIATEKRGCSTAPSPAGRWAWLGAVWLGGATLLRRRPRRRCLGMLAPTRGNAATWEDGKT